MLTLELEAPESSIKLREIALKLRSSKKTVVVAGAGISCNAGIPDFRSKDGLYALVKQQYQDTLVKGKDLFDIILFRDARSTQIFYSFMAGLRDATKEAQPTPTHHLLKLLRDKKKLLRCYTQNIDGLEFRAGLGTSETVQLHGNIHQLKCMKCSQAYEWSPEYTREMQDGDAPECENCINSSLARTLSGKRSTAIGQLRPDIVLYGEDHPGGDEIALTLKKDCSRSPQLLIVAGTSLKVIGIKRLVKTLAQATHAAGGMVVFVNKTPISKSEWDNVFDYHVLSDTDAWVAAVRAQIPTFFERQTKLTVDRKRKATTTDSVNLESVLIKNGIQSNGMQGNDANLAAEHTTSNHTTLNHLTSSSISSNLSPKPKDEELDFVTSSKDLEAKVFPADDARQDVHKDLDQYVDDTSGEYDNSKVEGGVVHLAKKTKSDPYGDTVQQNTLLHSPSASFRSFNSELSQDTLSSPATDITDLPDDIPFLKLESNTDIN